jgi:hypothetical protein
LASPNWPDRESNFGDSLILAMGWWNLRFAFSIKYDKNARFQFFAWSRSIRELWM